MAYHTLESFPQSQAFYVPKFYKHVYQATSLII